MDLIIQHNRSRLSQPMKVLAGNYLTSFTNGLNVRVRLNNFATGEMENSTSPEVEHPELTENTKPDQAELERQHAPPTVMTVATIPNDSEKQISIVSPDVQLGMVPVAMRQRKYSNALQTLYVLIPEQLRETEMLIHTSFSRRILSKSDLERLRCALKVDGETARVIKLLDILMDKPEDQIESFIELLDTFNQKELASLIRKAADEHVSQFYNGNIMTRQQVLTDVPLGNQGDAIKQKALQEKCGKEQTFRFILNAVPLPEPKGKEIQSFVGSKKHLHISLTTLMGNQRVIDSLTRSLYKLKSEFIRGVGVTCNCTTIDKRVENSQTESSCDALASVGLVAGEKEVFELLESKLLELENYLFQGKGYIVSIIEGCIKVTVQVNDSHHLEGLVCDIKSGALLYRITEWLKREGYSGSDNEDTEPAFMLTVDEDAIQALKLALIETENVSGDRLTFPVSYTYCQHEQKWYWSPDRTHWFDQDTKVVLHGVYKDKTIGEVDEMLLAEMTKTTAMPSCLPDQCIPCALRSENIKTTSKLSVTHKRPCESKGKEQRERKTDERSGVAMLTLSEICNRVCPVELFREEIGVNWQKLFSSEMEAIFSSMLQENETGQRSLRLEYYGNIVDGMPLGVNAGDAYFQCLFISQNNLVGYDYDIFDDTNDIMCRVANEQCNSNKLQLQTNTPGHMQYISSAQKSNDFCRGINQIIDEKCADEMKMFGGMFPAFYKDQGFETRKSDTYTRYPQQDQRKDNLNGEQSTYHTIQGCTTVPIQVNATVNTDLLPFARLLVNRQNLTMPTNCRVSLAYPCISWPTCAANWVHRKKPQGWPTEAFVDDTLTEGCYVIPAPSSGNLSWEFCFGIVEKKLLATIPKHYKQVLFLLNLVSEQARSLYNFPMKFHWQTVLFWECEKHGLMNENIADLFFRLIDRMTSILISKTMPDYFIDKCNLLAHLSDRDITRLTGILKKMRNQPVDFLSDHFKVHQSRLLPRAKSVKAIFADALQDAENLETCISKLISCLLEEKNDGAALDHIMLFPHKEKHLKICTESWIAKIGPRMKLLKDDFLFSKYLVDTYPKSQKIANYKGRLALMYVSLDLHGPEAFECESETLPYSEKAKLLFKEAMHILSNTNRDLHMCYAYYLFLQKKYEMAIECLQDLMNKPLPIQPALVLRKEFLEKNLWELALSSDMVVLWHLTFGLYIMIKSYQALGQKQEGKKLLDQLKDTAVKIPTTEGGNIEVHSTSLGLLGKAASDLEEYKISSEAYREKAEVQKLLVACEDSKVSRWLTIPPSVYTADFKYPFESDFSKNHPM